MRRPVDQFVGRHDAGGGRDVTSAKRKVPDPPSVHQIAVATVCGFNRRRCSSFSDVPAPERRAVDPGVIHAPGHQHNSGPTGPKRISACRSRARTIARERQSRRRPRRACRAHALWSCARCSTGTRQAINISRGSGAVAAGKSVASACLLWHRCRGMVLRGEAIRVGSKAESRAACSITEYVTKNRFGRHPPR